jgi:anti-sigma-K factor RskA
MSRDPSDKLPPEELDLLAAEYALGVLEADQLDMATGLIERDPEFASLVWDWNNRLAPLSDQIAWAEPDASVWSRIQEQLAAQDMAGPTQSLDTGAGAEIIQLRRSVQRWRGVALTITAIAASAVMLLVANPSWLPPLGQDRVGQEQFIALLTPPGSQEPAWVAAIDVKSRQIMLVPYRALEVSSEQVHELWYIQDTDSAPRSLGLVVGSGHLPVPENIVTHGGTLAVSLEPSGGSPTGLPTGPVVLLGEMKPLN